MTTIAATSSATVPVSSSTSSSASYAASQTSSAAATSTSRTSSPAVIVDISPAVSAQASGTANSSESQFVTGYNERINGLNAISKANQIATQSGYWSKVESIVGEDAWSKMQASRAELTAGETSDTAAMQTQAKAEFGNSIQFDSNGAASIVSTTVGNATTNIATSNAATVNIASANSSSAPTAAQAAQTLAVSKAAANTTTQQQSATDGSIALSLLMGSAGG